MLRKPIPITVMGIVMAAIITMVRDIITVIVETIIGITIAVVITIITIAAIITDIIMAADIIIITITTDTTLTADGQMEDKFAGKNV